MMSDSKLWEARRLVAKVGAIMLQRNLTDLAGGNISMRVDDTIVMSPTLAGQNKFWELQPEDVLVLDLRGNKLEGEGGISREGPTHLKLLNHFYPVGKAVIHAHPKNTLVFCATRHCIPPILEGTAKFGEINLIEYANGGIFSEKLAENVLAGLIGQEERIAKQAALVLAPWHGVFAIGTSLPATMDAVERIENNAYCYLMSKLLLARTESLEVHRQALMEAMQAAMGGSGE